MYKKSVVDGGGIIYIRVNYLLFIKCFVCFSDNILELKQKVKIHFATAPTDAAGVYTTLNAY